MKIKLSSVLIISTTLFFLLINCKDKTISFDNKVSFNKEENISYGNHSSQIMDLYMPVQNADIKRDVIIMIHGGGWRSGNKSQLTFFGLSLMKKFPWYIFANINYRLASATDYALPGQLDDITAVMDFLENKLHYSPQFILLGNSAGGHLSMLYGYQADHSRKIKAVINIVGPTDLSDSGFKNYQEYSFLEKRLVNPRCIEPGGSSFNFASPVYWISENSPPTLSYYGNSDRVIPSTQEKILDSALTKNNVIHESYQFNGGHLDWDKQPNDKFLIDKIEAFLKADKK
ncbi:alpha/beta hydrolase [Chryseobacterium pennipullorum]|uniref:Alpha/beta hydrolase n=1 Tax=Chryseobacterium pennipullorum TaxID=2258963 RepID=A0A3D9B6B8_9FLAO|nr:alpha/beta hydrolase [Chryseobacterium pennipullorum]REC49133.1 alpha/beta hydrolase [Chryseobacterium pennipullorum]